MSKIHTLTQLQDAMTEEFAWRKKELHGLKSLVSANEKTHNRNLFIRAAVPLLYAHWEGFIKQIGNCYLQFVALQKLKNDEMPSHFMAMVVHGIVRDAAASSKLRQSMDLVAFFRSQRDDRCKLNWRSGVKTKSNLKSEVLREIVESLGLDYSRFATKEKLIDEKLLSNRNTIAHGEYALVTFDEYMGLHDDILALMQEFFDQVETAAFNGAYRLK